jgi:hypothetical protein
MNLVSSPHEKLQCETSVGTEFGGDLTRLGGFCIMSGDNATMSGPAIRPDDDTFNDSDFKLLSLHKIFKL